MKIVIYDGNNWFRRRIETDLTGNAVSNCFFEVQNHPAFPIIVWDGFNSRKKRKELYPEYKNHRIKAGESIYESQKMLADCLKLGKGVCISIAEYEADDIIGHLARKYQKEGHDVFIESNDEDFRQLGIPQAKSKFKEEPKWTVLYKTLVGDSSDNIKGAKGFGGGTWERLTEENKTLLNAVVVSYINESEDRIAEVLEPLPLPKGVKNWMQLKENREQLLIYNKIVNFLPVSEQEITDNTTTNANKPELAYPIFKEFMI